MGATVHGVDVVGKAENTFGISVVVLQPDLHGHAIALGFHVDGFFVEHLLSLVEVLDEFCNAATVLEFSLLGLTGLGISSALVNKSDEQAFIQKSQLAQALRQGVKVVFRGSKDFPVRQKMDFGAGLFGRTDFLELGGGFSFGVALLPSEPITANFQVEFFTEGVND